jgi:hypothetical protein
MSITSQVASGSDLGFLPCPVQLADGEFGVDLLLGIFTTWHSFGVFFYLSESVGQHRLERRVVMQCVDLFVRYFVLVLLLVRDPPPVSSGRARICPVAFGAVSLMGSPSGCYFSPSTRLNT